MACTSRRLKEENVTDAGGRTSATAASYAASLFRCSGDWRGVRLRRFGPIRCASLSASLWAAQRYPCTSVMVWSAPPTSSATADLVWPLNAAKCSAVHLPDGARRNRQSRRPTNAAGRAEGNGRTRMGLWCSGRRARRRAARRSCDGRSARHTSRRCTHPCARRGMAAGVSPDQRIPLTLGTRSNPSQSMRYGWRSRGAAAEGSSSKLRRCRVKMDSGEFWHTLSVLAYRPPLVPPSKSATTASVKRRA